MSGVTRVPSLLESAIRSAAAGTNAAVKAALEISDFDPTNIEIDVNQLQIDVSGLETDLGDLETIVQDVSANLSTDIDNLDLAFTQLIAEECLRADTPVVTGSDNTVNGYLEVNINGTTYKLATIA